MLDSPMVEKKEVIDTTPERIPMKKYIVKRVNILNNNYYYKVKRWVLHCIASGSSHQWVMHSI